MFLSRFGDVPSSQKSWVEFLSRVSFTFAIFIPFSRFSWSKASRKLSDEKLSDEKLSDEKLSDEKLSDEQLSDEQLSDEQLSDEKLSDEPAGLRLRWSSHGVHSVDRRRSHRTYKASPFLAKVEQREKERWGKEKNPEGELVIPLFFSFLSLHSLDRVSSH